MLHLPHAFRYSRKSELAGVCHTAPVRPARFLPARAALFRILTLLLLLLLVRVVADLDAALHLALSRPAATLQRHPDHCEREVLSGLLPTSNPTWGSHKFCVYLCF